MAVIEVGITPADQNDRTSSGDYTYVEAGSPADGTGTIDTVSWWNNATLSGVEVASFSAVGNVLTVNGYTATLSGTFASGVHTVSAPGDFTAFNIDEDDYIGLHWTSGRMERASSGGGGYWFVAGDAIAEDLETTFSIDSDGILPIYGSGVTGSTVLPINVTGSLPAMAGALSLKKSYHRALEGSI